MILLLVGAGLLCALGASVGLAAVFSERIRRQGSWYMVMVALCASSTTLSVASMLLRGY